MKKVFLGLLVAGVALAGSAFTNAKFAAGDVYGNISSTSPQYKKLINPYNPILCQNAVTSKCAYTVTSAGASTVTASTYTEAQLEAFANSVPAKVTRSTDLGLYLGN